VIGQMLPDLMFGCLEAALDGQVPGESAGSIWVLAMTGAGPAAQPFNTMSVGLGGTGARPRKDGLSTTAFPSGVGGIPVEVTEAAAPLVFWHKEFLTDSGGAGTTRGGLAQRIEVGGRDGVAFTCSAATFDRRAHAARGRRGGHDGALGAVRVIDGSTQRRIDGKGTIDVPAGARLRVDLPGGGGFGLPRERPREAVAADVAAGLVSMDAAQRLYGFAASDDSRNTTTDTARSPA
jgi:N-methylhydantoinase B/oxoprolinase/acetone carboxylase alpha subunit